MPSKTMMIILLILLTITISIISTKSKINRSYEQIWTDQTITNLIHQKSQSKNNQEKITEQQPPHENPKTIRDAMMDLITMSRFHLEISINLMATVKDDGTHDASEIKDMEEAIELIRKRILKCEMILISIGPELDEFNKTYLGIGEALSGAEKVRQKIIPKEAPLKKKKRGEPNKPKMKGVTKMA